MKPSARLFNIIPLFAAALTLVGCKVEFSPNAPWRDVPSVYCILDPEEDTVWARVQRCYLGEEDLHHYAQTRDSVYYQRGEVSVKMLVWQGSRVAGNHIVQASPKRLVDEWDFDYTERPGKPEGAFPDGLQPLFYFPAGHRLVRDTACFFELLVIKNATGDTLARATTTMVGMLPKVRRNPTPLSDSIERVITRPDTMNIFSYTFGCRGEIKWNTLPRGRLYQPVLTFLYRKGADTLGIVVGGNTVLNSRNVSTLTDKSISKNRLISAVGLALAGNRDSLFYIDTVEIALSVCNEDLNAYINSQNANRTSGQESTAYSNIEGGVGIFGSRRSHIRVRVPSDPDSGPNSILQALMDLRIGFYGRW